MLRKYPKKNSYNLATTDEQRRDNLEHIRNRVEDQVYYLPRSKKVAIVFGSGLEIYKVALVYEMPDKLQPGVLYLSRENNGTIHCVMSHPFQYSEKIKLELTPEDISHIGDGALNSLFNSPKDPLLRGKQVTAIKLFKSALIKYNKQFKESELDNRSYKKANALMQYLKNNFYGMGARNNRLSTPPKMGKCPFDKNKWYVLLDEKDYNQYQETIYKNLNRKDKANDKLSPTECLIQKGVVGSFSTKEVGGESYYLQLPRLTTLQAQISDNFLTILSIKPPSSLRSTFFHRGSANNVAFNDNKAGIIINSNTQSQLSKAGNTLGLSHSTEVNDNRNVPIKFCRYLKNLIETYDKTFSTSKTWRAEKQQLIPLLDKTISYDYDSNEAINSVTTRVGRIIQNCINFLNNLSNSKTLKQLEKYDNFVNDAELLMSEADYELLKVDKELADQLERAATNTNNKRDFLDDLTRHANFGK